VGYLGHKTETGALSAANKVTSGAWVVTFTPDVFGQGDIDFEVWHGAARGPGGYFETYLDETFYGVGENGRINEYTPSLPMFVRRGQTFSVHWSIATGTAPTVTLFLREPEVGIFS
jgi:hypothetical protein